MPTPDDPNATQDTSPDDLHIVTPTDEDISIGEAAALAGVSHTTLRRAVQLGRLPRRFAHGPHGLQLVFWRPDVERWRSARAARQPANAQQAQLSRHRVRSRGSDEAAHYYVLTMENRQDVLLALQGLLEELVDLSVRVNALIAALRADTPPPNGA